MTRLFSLLVSAALAAAVPAQRQTYIVSTTGEGHFTEIAAALEAARAGDTILVRPGVYSVFTVDKGVRLIGEPGVSAGAFFATYRVQGVPAGETLVVRGIDPVLMPLAARLSVRDCAGHVHLESMSLAAGLEIINSRQVSLHDLQIIGPTPAGLDVQGSTVIVSQSEISGLLGLPQVAGVLCTSSNVVLSETSVAGGPGYRFGAGMGVRVASGQVTIAGDSSVEIKAVSSPFGGTESAIVVDSGTLVLEPAVTLTPIEPLPPITVNGGTVIQKRVASFTADVAPLQLTARLHAPEATLAGLLGGPALMPSVSSPLGELWLGPVHFVMDLGTVEPNGVRTATVGIAPVPVGAQLAMQWILLRAGGVELSTPVVRTMDQ